MSVPQQVVLITGASRGFGAAAARRIADRGHVVVATMRSADRDGPAVAAGFEDLIETVRLDVTDAAEVERVVAGALERHGRIDVAINNAGYGLYGPVECGTEDQLWRQLDTNVLGPLRVIRAALPSMRARRQGKIVNLTSVSGLIVGPLLAHYAATKFAVDALTEGLRFEVGDLGVQVCAVVPGMFASDWQTTNLEIAEGADGDAYADVVTRRLKAFRELAATRPGPASVAAALADIVDLQQRLPLRWPVGQDAVHQVPIRSSVSDEQWAQLCRAGAFGAWREPLHLTPPEPAPHSWSGENVVVITGGSRGFGAAAARELAARGNIVVATMREPDRDAKAVVDGYEDRIHPFRLDVTDLAATVACVEDAMRRFGRVDALVNNAGYGLFGAQEDLTDNEVRRQFDTNLIGQWRMIRTAAPYMRSQGYGKIVNVSSLSGRVPSPLLSCYAATKHAVEAMSEGLAGELAAWGVQVTILEPGMYASDWQTTNLDVCERAQSGASAYRRATDRGLTEFRARAATRPGSDAVAAGIADIVQLQQPLPLRWPIGEDAYHMLGHRRRDTDDEWEARMRAVGWGFRPDEVDR
jgi:NAD(P)-dependent dehydrogenase (short-subunit alcohol dehydrogenase family)